MPKQERLTLIILTSVAVVTALLSSISLYRNFTVVVPTSGGEYREGIIGQPKYINPVLATSGTDKAINKLVYSGLYTYDDNGKIIPDLAEAMPEIDETRKIYTIKLKENIKWHNDLPFSAEDVVFTIETLQNAEFNSPRRNDWLATKVEKTDSRTVVFTLKDASAPFIHNLTIPVINKTVWSKINASDFSQSSANIEAIGTGPYRIEEVRKTSDNTIQSISLKAFRDYAPHEAYISNLKLIFFEDTENVIKAIHGKQMDGFGNDSSDQNTEIDKSSNNFKFSSIALPQYQAVFFNLNKKLFQDSAVRKAFQFGTNYDSIIEQVYKNNGNRIYGPILPEQVEGINSLPENFISNVDEAKKLLDTAGWVFKENENTRSKNGNLLEFELTTNSLEVNSMAAGLLAQQWQALGAKVNVKILSTKELTDNVIFPREFDALLFAQKLGADPDPFVFWHSSQVKNPGLNLTGFANPVADKLINEARAANDKATREEKYTEFQKIIMADAPAIFLVQNVFTYAQKNNIKGQNYSTLQDDTLRFSTVANWYIDTKRVFR